MKYRRADHIAWRRIDEETILVDLAAKVMFGLNEDGGRLWDAFESPRVLSPMAVDIATASGGEVPSADSEAFLNRLVELGLLVATEGPQAVPDAPAEIPVLVASPELVWQEDVRQAAGTCAFLPGSSFLCNQAPFS